MATNSKPTQAAPVVLLVDDQAIVGEMVRRILSTQADIQFHFCARSDTAVATAEVRNPTVILQDLSMPDTDGLELLRQYQQHEDLRDVPVIVLSGKEDPKVKAEAFAQGASDYIVKLPDPVELVARVRRHSLGYIHLVERRRSEEALRTAEASARQAAHEAQSANHAKSAFLANVGHELRTPLNAILGYAAMLREAQNLGPDQQRVVDAIEGHSAELAQMIERILSVSHLGGDDSPLEPGDFRLDRLLAELEAAFGSRCERKGLGWTIDADVADGWVHGDSKKLQQTLVHLLDNAVKFTDSGGVSLTVSGDADHFRFEVRDSGSGIEPALREDVLAAFHQGDAAIGPGGVGLGLTIAHRHVEQMGGALQIEAGEQGGTAVSFDLPLPPAAGTPTARHDEAPAVGSDTAAEATEAPRIRLPAELQQGLQEALSTHSMSDLRKAIDEVEVLDAEGRRLASQLRDLSQRFDLAAIAALLKEVAND